jgi:L-fuculose-phosphate aldolase
MSDARGEAISVLPAALVMARRLLDAGVVVAAQGGFSARAGRTVVITPGDVDWRTLGAADLSIVDLVSGRSIGPRPTAELELHLAIYRKRKEVGAVVRIDSPYVKTVAAARRPVPPVLEELAQIAGPTVRVAEPALPTTAAGVPAVLKALRGRLAALVASDGGVCLGRNLDEALLCCQVLERGCRTFVEAHFLGGAKRLSRLEAFVMHQYYLRRYSKVWQEQRP